MKTVVAFTPTINSPTASSTPSITYCVCAARSVTVTVQRILPIEPFLCFQKKTISDEKIGYANVSMETILRQHNQKEHMDKV